MLKILNINKLFLYSNIELYKLNNYEFVRVFDRIMKWREYFRIGKNK